MSTKTYTPEQRAAMQDVLDLVRQEADNKGYGSYAGEILRKVERTFREPHPADTAAESYAGQNSRWSEQDVVEDAFRAGYDFALNSAPAPESTAEAIHAA